MLLFKSYDDHLNTHRFRGLSGLLRLLGGLGGGGWKLLLGGFGGGLSDGLLFLGGLLNGDLQI